MPEQREAHTFCRDTGKTAIKGVCPEHGGDACLIVPLYMAAENKRRLERAVAAERERDEAQKALRDTDHLLASMYADGVPDRRIPEARSLIGDVLRKRDDGDDG